MSNDITKLTGTALGNEINRRIEEGNGKVTLIGFGSFKRVTKPARTARNPRTGEAVAVPARETITFKAAK